MNTSPTTTSPFRQKSKTMGYKSSPTVAHQLELALQDEEEHRMQQHLEHAYNRSNSTTKTSTTATNRSHSTLRKQYFRHCRTDSENERENSKRMSKTLQANDERNWKKHQSLKMDPLDRIGYSASMMDSSCGSQSTTNRNIFSKFISKLSKKKSSNNLF